MGILGFGLVDLLLLQSNDALAHTDPDPPDDLDPHAAWKRDYEEAAGPDLRGEVPTYPAYLKVPPKIHGRAAWKAKPPRRPAKILGRAPDHIVVHHTDSPNTSDRSLAHAYDLSRSIQRFHMQGRGWDDAGQQLTISRGGHIMEGRNRSLAAILAGQHVVGAQALHHNDHTIGIENEGNYTKSKVPPPLWDALVDTCVWLCAVYRLDPTKAIVGHRDLVDTDCPGNLLYAKLPTLRRTVSTRLTTPRKPAQKPKPKPKSKPKPPSTTNPKPRS
ncbi:peptidoglycan recognition protein family protein [Spirillospora sp. CA-294931]|uniref:peptidoglycan recognition protein family protein n=1 Tax=Spirillospora sp. CA-294931 TaxID=3240042 RepID=UPI003D8ADFD5